MKLWLLILAICLFGCGGRESSETSRDDGGVTQDESVFDPMVQTMDQAKGVEQLSADRKRELDREIETSE